MIENESEENFDYETFFNKLELVKISKEHDYTRKYSIYHTMLDFNEDVEEDTKVPKEYEFKHFSSFKPLTWYKVKKICSECGEIFYGTKKGDAQYCSKCRVAKGNEAPNWKGGLSFEPYCPKFNEELKTKVRTHFNNECVLCGKTKKENKRELPVHHVNYDKGQGCSGKWLLVPLCNSCHSKTNSDRDYWEDYFTNFLAQYNFNCGAD